MIKKVMPLMVLGMAAQDYYNKSGKKWKKKVAKKKLEKSKRRKCDSCGGKGCSKCMSNTGDGTGAAQGKYK